jgi:hypothetical protein
MLSAGSKANRSVLDLARGIPSENILSVVKQRLQEQDKGIEREYIQNLSGGRLQAYHQLHGQKESGHAHQDIAKLVPTPRVVPSSNSLSINNGSERRSRHPSSGSYRLSESGSHLGSIHESDLSSTSPPPVRRATKPSLESMASAALPAPHGHQINSPHLGLHAVGPSTSVTSSDNRLSSVPNVPLVLGDSRQRHNTMRSHGSANLHSQKSLVRAREIIIPPRQQGKENMNI